MVMMVVGRTLALAVALCCAGCAAGAHITVVTGTHATPATESLRSKTQSPNCQAVNAELRTLWTHFNGEMSKYTRAREQLEAALRKLEPEERCTISATSRGYLYTFPMAIKSNGNCDGGLQKVLSSRSFSLGQGSPEARSRITVPWFLLRPDLVTLEEVATAAGVDMRVLATVGHDAESAAFSLEGCPRFAKIMLDRAIYRQRLLLVGLSDLAHQIERLKTAEVVVNVCDDSQQSRRALAALFEEGSASVSYRSLEEKLNVRVVDRDVFSQPELACPRSAELHESMLDDSHMPSMLAGPLFMGKVLRKTVFATAENPKPKLVFVAGVEGTGHHLWSVLGRKHTVRPLYDALTEYLGDSAWTDDSWEQYGPARAALVQTMRNLHQEPVGEDGSNLFFLNTVFVEKAVNMYSYPWGGPRCHLKKYARVVCNIDLFELARMAEEADVDFRVVVQRRSFGAAIVSSSINRNFGTLASQTRLLGQSWSLLRMSLRTLDEAFYEHFEYETMLQEPQETASRLAAHLGLDEDSELAKHFAVTLQASHDEYGGRDPNAWRSKVDAHQMRFMKDLLRL